MTTMTPAFAVNYSSPVLGTDPDRLRAVAQHADRLGFEGFYVPEHVALYTGADLGGWEIPPDLAFLDALDVLTFVAAATERILLGTAVLLLPHHHPVPLAKRLATIDVLSKGRMRLLAVGVGALAGEAAAAGIDFTTRGRRADEAISVLRQLWSDGPADFHGEFYDLTAVHSHPKPLAGAALPIHVGGASDAAARRAGRVGDGWFPGGRLGVEERRRHWALVRETAEAAGHDPDALQHTRTAPIDVTEDQVAELVKQGATRIMIGVPQGEPDEQLAELSAFAERFGLPKAS